MIVFRKHARHLVITPDQPLDLGLIQSARLLRGDLIPQEALPVEFRDVNQRGVRQLVDNQLTKGIADRGTVPYLRLAPTLICNPI